MDTSAVSANATDEDFELDFAEDAELNALADARADQAVISVALSDL